MFPGSVRPPSPAGPGCPSRTDPFLLPRSPGGPAPSSPGRATVVAVFRSPPVSLPFRFSRPGSSSEGGRGPTGRQSRFGAPVAGRRARGEGRLLRAASLKARTGTGTGGERAAAGCPCPGGVGVCVCWRGGGGRDSRPLSCRRRGPGGGGGVWPTRGGAPPFPRRPGHGAPRGAGEPGPAVRGGGVCATRRFVHVSENCFKRAGRHRVSARESEKAGKEETSLCWPASGKGLWTGEVRWPRVGRQR